MFALEIMRFAGVVAENPVVALVIFAFAKTGCAVGAV
jgi:hypothetical protein